MESLIDLPALIQVTVVCMMRPLAMIAVFPALNRRLLGSALAYNAVILAIALPMVPRFLATGLAQDVTISLLVTLILTEGLIGVCLGFVSAIPFWAIQVAGEMMDSVRGASISTALSPLTETETSLFGNLFNQLVTVLFFCHGGFEILLKGFYDSYRSFPPGEGFRTLGGLGAFVSQQWAALWDLGLTFALPALGAMILVDIALGLVNKSVKQLPVFFLSMPVKSVVGILVIALGLSFSIDAYLKKMRAYEATAITVRPFE